jgi:hypothetical protein
VKGFDFPEAVGMVRHIKVAPGVELKVCILSRREDYWAQSSFWGEGSLMPLGRLKEAARYVESR